MEDMSLDAVISRHCRSVLVANQFNKKEACRILGISWHTLKKYIARPAEPELSVPIARVRETQSEHLMRLQIAISNVSTDVLLREIILAEQRGAREQARQTIAHLRPVAGVESLTV